MKKILWLSNIAFSENPLAHSGGWLQPLAEALQCTGRVQISNVTFGDTSVVIQKDCAGFQQWIIPERTSGYGQIATRKTCEEVARIEQIVQPDLVHAWGTEGAWISIHEKGYLKSPVLVDMQGLVFVIADYFYGGLSFSEILQCIRLKEIIMPWRMLFWKKRVFEKRGQYEVKNIKSLSNISCQSEWVKHQLSVILPNVFCHSTKIMLRKPFYTATLWQYRKTDSPVVFSMCSAATSFKGIHVLIKAIGALKKKYPTIQLQLAGSIDVGNRLQDGYSVFLRKLIKKYNISDNVQYLGHLNAEQIISDLQNCHVCVVPSFIESYCMVLAEAMIIGVPAVVSYTGSMPDLATHKKSALFYNSLDHGLCAAYIDMLISDQTIAETISANARKNRLIENDPSAVVDTQLEIYSSILRHEK